MKPFPNYLVLIPLLLFGSGVSGEVGSTADVLSCDGPICDSVAESAVYVHQKLANSITLKTEHFSIEVPDNPIKKIVFSGKDLIIFYGDGQLLYFSESKGPEIEGLSPDLVFQYPEIIFLKTKKDVPLKAGKEKLFWQTALASKPFYFEGASEVCYAKKNDLTYYLTDTHELGFSARGMVTNSRFKHIFLVVEAKQMGFDTFKQVAYSVK